MYNYNRKTFLDRFYRYGDRYLIGSTINKIVNYTKFYAVYIEKKGLKCLSSLKFKSINIDTVVFWYKLKPSSNG